jgi:DNA-binding LacI/PurR family transcriptional regulator
VLLPRGKALNVVDHHLIGSGVDGLLISTLSDFNLLSLQEPVYAVERRWDRPIVALNIGTLKKSRISTVSFSNFQAAYMAVKHLIRKGHQRIGLIYTDDGAPDVVERVSAYKTALSDHRIAFDPTLVAEGAYLADSGYDAAIQILKRPESEGMTALFCTNDEMAFGALRALKILGKVCPNDIAVMGFDGLSAGELVEPALSSVEQPFFEIAKAGTNLLFDLIEGRQTKPIQQTTPTKLIIRDSA